MTFYVTFRSVHWDEWSPTTEQNIPTSHSCSSGSCVGDFSEVAKSCWEMITVLLTSAQSCLDLGWPMCTYGTIPVPHAQAINKPVNNMSTNVRFLLEEIHKREMWRKLYCDWFIGVVSLTEIPETGIFPCNEIVPDFLTICLLIRRFR